MCIRVHLYTGRPSPSMPHPCFRCDINKLQAFRVFLKTYIKHFACFRKTNLALSVWLGWLGWGCSHYLIFIILFEITKMAGVPSVSRNKGWALRMFLKNRSGAFRLAGLAGLGLRSLFCFHYTLWNEKIAGGSSVLKNICWAFRLFYYTKPGGFRLCGLAGLGLLSLCGSQYIFWNKQMAGVSSVF